MKKRTTVAANADDLDVLREEAHRLKIPLSDLLSGLIAEKAAEIQAHRRPRLGIGRSGRSNLGRESSTNEASPASTPRAQLKES